MPPALEVVLKEQESLSRQHLEGVEWWFQKTQVHVEAPGTCDGDLLWEKVLVGVIKPWILSRDHPGLPEGPQSRDKRP